MTTFSLCVILISFSYTLSFTLTPFSSTVQYFIFIALSFSITICASLLFCFHTCRYVRFWGKMFGVQIRPDLPISIYLLRSNTLSQPRNKRKSFTKYLALVVRSTSVRPRDASKLGSSSTEKLALEPRPLVSYKFGKKAIP